MKTKVDFTGSLLPIDGRSSNTDDPGEPMSLGFGSNPAKAVCACFVAVLGFGGAFGARAGLGAEPCPEQPDYRAMCPVPLDPNLPGDVAVLSAVPGDPNAWTVDAGPWARPAGRACDKDGDKFEIVCHGWAIEHDKTAGTWQIIGTVQVGVNFIWIEAIDRWKNTRQILLVIIGLPPAGNTGPVLE